jgi:elongation factor 1-gamma
MTFGKIFASKGNPRTTAILAVAKANGLELEFVESTNANPAPDHAKASPLVKVPAFLGADGFALHETIAIAIYITSQNEKTTLLGKTKQDYATIVKWLSYFNNEVLPTLAEWYLPLLGRKSYNKKAVEDSSKVALKAVAVIEEHLLHNTYLAGERITLADLFGAGIITRGFQYFFDKKWRADNPNVSRWYETVINQPIYAEVAEKLNFLDEPALQNVAPKKADAPPKKEKEAKPKAEKKPEAEAEEDEAPKEPKPKHPLDLLPKATFALDDWKREYSNNPAPEALKWFWEHCNFEEYSLWKVKYKYNDELTLTFMSSNLIGGFFNRLEASRKYLFGGASVYGVNRDSIIEGAFVARGQEYLPVFDVAPDYESYDFVKLDPNNAEDKAYVEAQWTMEAPITVDGKEYPHASGKVFK